MDDRPDDHTREVSPLERAPARLPVGLPVDELGLSVTAEKVARAMQSLGLCTFTDPAHIEKPAKLGALDVKAGLAELERLGLVQSVGRGLSFRLLKIHPAS